MKCDQISVLRIQENCFAARSVPRVSVSGYQLCPAALHHRDAIHISKRSMRACAASNHDSVGVQVRIRIAAIVERGEQIVVVVFVYQRSSFNVIKQNAWPRGELINRLISHHQFAGAGINLLLLDSGPVTAVGHPHAAVGIHENTRIDGIEVIFG